MKFNLNHFFRVFILSLCLSCDSSEKSIENRIPMDAATVSDGQTIFENNCSTCHNFNQDGIGPHLGGLTREEPLEWIRDFIKNPTAVIQSGDERAANLFAKFNTYMPSFDHLPAEEIDAIIAYMHQHEAPAEKTKTRSDSIVNPIPEPIPLSELVVELEWIATIPPSSEEMPRTRIAKLDFHPGTKDLFIMDLRGKMYRIAGDKTEEYMDMEKLMPDFINQPGLATGFGSFAFHPEFSENGLLYTTHTESPGSGKADFTFGDSIRNTLQWVVLEWQTDNANGIPFKGKSRELFRIDMVTGIHGMQEITFNPLASPGEEDYGLLYIGIGDGGSVGAGHAWVPHGPTQPWGCIFRIDPSGNNSRNRKYGIPKSNPFVNNGKGWLEEIYAHGFRNAHRITWTKNGECLATNIGQMQIESLYMVKPGDDYGWPVREGTFVIDPEIDINQVFPLPEDDEKYGYTYPVAMYDHDEGNAISGGYEYWGTHVPALEGKYLFGDIVQGRLFYIHTAELQRGSHAPIYEWRISFEGKVQSLVELCGSKRVDLRFGRDHEGELYLFTKPDGKVYKMKNTL
ncbi:PQQ-dependent sugar dehydrogenase [Negadavirga shengliensis]|uniref:PQQ-dependent sugar dehydrogenase n=1 Tax=Negadavirga shengliensis TaxID=1389218 RepID=A0ABV9T0N7_9BACT